MASVFAEYQIQNYAFTFEGNLHFESIAGGTPLDPAMLERHISSKIDLPDNLVRDAVATILQEREEAGDPISVEQAVEEAAKLKGLVGFYADENGYYIPGANLKAAIVESACIAAAADRLDARGWGKTNAGIKKWLTEHVFVTNNRCYLRKDGEAVRECSTVQQSFIHKVLPGRGPISAIQYTELLYEVDLPFTLECDHDFKREDWAAIFLTLERNGVGAARKRGYGVSEVTKFDSANGNGKSKAASNGKATAAAVSA